MVPPRVLSLLLLTALTMADGCAPSGSAGPVRPPVSHRPAAGTNFEIGRVLDDFHDAASKADEARYFAHFAPGAVFLGTDAKERWPLAAFRVYAHPHFAKGKGWTYRVTSRHIAVSARGDVAWVDEALTGRIGACRGTVVLVREGGTFRIAQYSLALTVPNEKVAELQKLLATD